MVAVERYEPVQGTDAVGTLLNGITGEEDGRIVKDIS